MSDEIDSDGRLRPKSKRRSLSSNRHGHGETCSLSVLDAAKLDGDGAHNGRLVTRDGMSSKGGEGEGEGIVCISREGDLLLRFSSGADSSAGSVGTNGSHFSEDDTPTVSDGDHQQGSDSDEHVPSPRKRHSVGQRYYLVDSHRLQAGSRFFSALLGPHRFSEGAAISESHAALRREGVKPAAAPIEALPQIDISEQGGAIAEYLLRILHGEDVLACVGSKRPSPILLSHVANLAVLADRFDCLVFVAGYLRSQGLFDLLDARSRGKTVAKLGEERLRQRVLVGWLFGLDGWVLNCSTRLVLGGSTQWRVDDEGVVDPESKGMWWHLSDDIEEELVYRRERILDTVDSLQRQFITLYTSRERQCKLGYDSSSQCDSFQLGEMIRFFTRIDTLKIHGLVVPEESDPSHARDIEQLIATMRQCPSYQIDRNHVHCGIRTKLIPALDHLEASVITDGGICRRCWADDRSNQSWSDSEPAGHWTFKGNSASGGSNGSAGKDRACKTGHRQARTMFMASTRDWTPSP